MTNDRLSIICGYLKEENDAGQIGVALCVSRSSDNDVYVAIRYFSDKSEINVEDCIKPRHVPVKSEDRVYRSIYNELKKFWQDAGNNFDKAEVYSKVIKGFLERFDGLGLADRLNNQFAKEGLALRVEA